MSVSFCLPHPVAGSLLSCVVACVLVLRCCECVLLTSSATVIFFAQGEPFG